MKVHVKMPIENIQNPLCLFMHYDSLDATQ